jgi:hypothetical protein
MEKNQNIAYDRYEKKMAKYRKNLAKRNNGTKVSTWLKWGEHTCIPEKEAKNQQNGMYEYDTTRRHNTIVSRYKYKFNWNIAAREAKQYNHDITVKGQIRTKFINNETLSEKELAILNTMLEHDKQREIEKQIQLRKYKEARLKKTNTPKAERLEKMPFSQYHYKLVNELYSDNKQDKILMQQAIAANHDQDISAMIKPEKPETSMAA